MSLSRDARDWLRASPGGVTNLLKNLLKGLPWAESAESQETLSFARPALGIVHLQNVNGRSCVHGEERDDIEIRISKRAHAESIPAAREFLEQVRVCSHERNGTLEIEVEIPSRWNRRGLVNIEARLPQNCELKVDSTNGRIEIRGIRGEVTARSSNGSANIDDVVGNVEVATSNARVSCSGTCGRLIAHSSNGRIVVNGHRGSLDASTSNGRIDADLDSIDQEGVQLATSNGHIAVALPEEIHANVDLRVDNGTIRNHRELCHSGRQTDGRVRGRLGNGGIAIRVRTSNGSISMR